MARIGGPTECPVRRSARRRPFLEGVMDSLPRRPASDGTPLHGRHWTPKGEPWARVLIVHGIGEHSGRYDRTGRLLAEAGLYAQAFGRRGHGLAGGRRVYVGRWDDFLDDVEEVVPPPHVYTSTARESVAAATESLGIQARLGQQPAGSIVPTAVFADAVDDQDSRPGFALRRPVPTVERGAVRGRPPRQ